LSFGTVHILVRQALAVCEMTSPSQVLFLQRKTEPEDQIIRSPQDDDATPSRDFALLGESVVLLSAQNVTEWRLGP
jgi:hypothetical protein